MTARRALVTGGAGFIGSHLVDALLAADWEVTIIDDLSTGRWENLVPALNRGAHLHAVSVTDAGAVTRVLEQERPDTVFHLAAQIDVRHAVADPVRDALINMVGTVTVLQAAQHAGVRRLLLASTGGAIYGDAATIPTPETAAAHAGSPYAASKAAAESYLDLYRELHRLSTLSLRLANVYGPRQNAAGEAGVIAIFSAAAAGPARTVTVYGDGGQTRDFVYVGDVVAAFLAAAECSHSGQINIGTGEETSVLHVARTLGLRVRHAPDRPGEVRRSCLDPRLAATVLGWRARTPLEDGLEHTLTSMAAATHPARAASAAP